MGGLRSRPHRGTRLCGRGSNLAPTPRRIGASAQEVRRWAERTLSARSPLALSDWGAYRPVLAALQAAGAAGRLPLERCLLSAQGCDEPPAYLQANLQAGLHEHEGRLHEEAGQPYDRAPPYTPSHAMTPSSPLRVLFLLANHPPPLTPHP